MNISFTAAAKRALQHAALWSAGKECSELEAEALLIGLLSETECRAAELLRKLAVDLSAIQQRWPALTQGAGLYGESEEAKPFSSEVKSSLLAAVQRLAFLPQPLELATEHILLGLAAGDHEVSLWLREQGLDPDALEAEIYRRYGCAPPGKEVESLAEPAVESPREEGSAVSPTIFRQPSPTALLRVWDAATNRAREALRVVEDYVRLVLDDRHLTELCKQLRHDLTAATAVISREDRLAARETRRDVGTTLTLGGESMRCNEANLPAANFARLQESLRSLEEYAKLLAEESAEQLKQLRYRAYSLERAVEMTRRGRQRLAGVNLCVLLDGRSSADEFQRLARTLAAVGVPMIQLRDKQLCDKELLSRAKMLRTIIDECSSPPETTSAAVQPQSQEESDGKNTLFIQNDRPDIAALAGADGVHLGQEDLSVKDARSILGPKALIGVSTHSLEQARQAVLDGADYIGVGPVFASQTKEFAKYTGVGLLQEVAAEISLPAFAIGGINVDNLPEVLAAGFKRVAVSSAIVSAREPATAAKEMLCRLNKQ